MTTIQESITATIKRTALPHLDVEVILAYVLNKSRTFILTYPEHKLTPAQQKKFKELIKKRVKGEPVAYILGHKEFYGLDFIINKHTLVPRPETELMVELTLELLRSMLRNKTIIIDVGTGSGCIITSIAHELEKDTGYLLQAYPRDKIQNTKYYAIDISKEALKIAKKNARLNGVDKKIKFLNSNLLSVFIRNTKYKIQNTNLILTANLPYLSKDIYNSAPIDVKKFEPKSALYSPEAGLQHYRKLLEQLKQIIVKSQMSKVTCFMEISPEQKIPLTKIIKAILPKAKIEFQKDLAKKWRICTITIHITPSP